MSRKRRAPQQELIPNVEDPEPPLRQMVGKRRQAGSAEDPVILPSSPIQSEEHRKGTAITSLGSQSAIPAIAVLPEKLPSQLEGLTAKGVMLLQHKRRLLTNSPSQFQQLDELSEPESSNHGLLKNALDATLVFAQEEAGTAVCISSTGLLLTCSHCVATSPSSLSLSQPTWLLFSSGQTVRAITIHWDPHRDLALLQIVAAQLPPSHPPLLSRRPVFSFSFPAVPVVTSEPSKAANLLCIGHPGSEDLEVGRRGVATGYDVLHVSEGKFRGYAPGQDEQDNSEIGALMHDCWTYWGHSGAPLVGRGTRNGRGVGNDGVGRLVGLHSSWDEETGMRRGVGGEAVRGFLREVAPGVLEG
ncbi:hypothetical protein EJ04DRAFT_558473 [Polyplosphaeria fusca]|uniref:AT hook domain-containing protein n=1 Tax=Polyplosphaeria fusca TaxID=682080 RepID=A0A9P4RDE9_9PLEO|nr:hypothetical protein EJ04DRAFT_558473 [Polyplosphaeria fusca]